MIVLKKIGDRSYLNTLTVGKIANVALRAIIESGVITGAITSNDIADFKDAGWTKSIFGVPFPLLSNDRDVVGKNGNSYTRYYEEEIYCYGEKLFLTNFWKEDRNKDLLIDWIVNWVSRNGIPPRADCCDADGRLVYYNHNVKNGERIAGLAQRLEVEYLQFIYHFAERLVGDLFREDFPEPIEVILCKERPEKVYNHSDESIMNKINELIKNGKSIDLEKTSDILRHTDYITGEFCTAEKPHIKIYFNQQLFINFEEDFAVISQVLAHEFMHYLVYAYRKMCKSSSGKSTLVNEALADFFGVLYSLNRADDLKSTPVLKDARELAAAMRYEEWAKFKGTGWPYAYALYFYSVCNKWLAFSYDFSDYVRHGSVDKLVNVFDATIDFKDAYSELINF